MHEPDPRVAAAIKHFWNTRSTQSITQGTGGDPSAKDRGARAAATGGKQMDGFVELVCALLVESGVHESLIRCKSHLELPGWFRAEKQWDLVVVHRKELVAAVEFKSQIGPSFGNNFNNRTEEALGSATDVWAAYREGAFKPSSRPFLGYLMLLEDCPKSRSPVKVAQPHFSVFQEFAQASYMDRYAILIQKLLRDRLYDSACFLLSASSAGATGEYTQPNDELTFAKFIGPLVAQVSAAARA